MQYPESFKRKFRKLHPKATLMLQCLDQGEVIIGSFLVTESKLEIDPEEIIKLFKQKREQDILVMAKKAIASAKLYQAWKKLYNEQHEESKDTAFD